MVETLTTANVRPSDNTEPGAPVLDLTVSPVALTSALVDIESVSRNEGAIADAVEDALRRHCPGYEILRDRHSVLLRTNLGRGKRVVLAGHLDTVPVAGNLPSRNDGKLIHGCGTTDMKSGVAVFLHLVATITEPAHDMTLILYDREELPPADNGVNRLIADHPEWLAGDVAILGEPTDGIIEAGCQGTLWADLTAAGKRAHTARGWLGANAISRLWPALQRIADYSAREIEIDGCLFREGLQAVKITGGTAPNVVPDHASVSVNFRFAPDRSVDDAAAHVRNLFTGLDVEVSITAAEPGARPGAGSELTSALTAAAGGRVDAKLGWTDVSRFAALGVPAVNLGPGDPNLAHTPGEYVRIDRIDAVTDIMRQLISPHA